MKISYQEIKRWIANLAEQLKGFKPDVLVIIAKWWLVGWYFLAKKLKVKKVVVLNFESYKWKTKGQIKSNNNCLNDWELCSYDKILIFDDLVDSWETMKAAIDYFIYAWPKIKTAVLFHKLTSTYMPDYIYKKVGNMWLNFVYEDPL